MFFHPVSSPCHLALPVCSAYTFTLPCQTVFSPLSLSFFCNLFIQSDISLCHYFVHSPFLIALLIHLCYMRIYASQTIIFRSLAFLSLSFCSPVLLIHVLLHHLPSLTHPSTPPFHSNLPGRTTALLDPQPCLPSPLCPSCLRVISVCVTFPQGSAGGSHQQLPRLDDQRNSCKTI